MSQTESIRELASSEQFPDRVGDVAAGLAYLALALLGEERQLGRVRPALAVRRHVTAAARELQGTHKPKHKKHRLRKVLGAALIAAVVIAALRKERAAP